MNFVYNNTSILISCDKCTALFLTWVLGLLNQYKLTKGQKRSSSKVLVGSPAAAEGKNTKQTTGSPACSLPKGWGGVSQFLIRGEDRGGARGHVKGVAWVVFPPLW